MLCDKGMNIHFKMRGLERHRAIRFVTRETVGINCDWTWTREVWHDLALCWKGGEINVCVLDKRDSLKLRCCLVRGVGFRHRNMSECSLYLSVLLNRYMCILLAASVANKLKAFYYRRHRLHSTGAAVLVYTWTEFIPDVYTGGTPGAPSSPSFAEVKISGAIPPFPLRFQGVHGNNFFLHCTVLIELSYDTHPRIYCITSTSLSLKPSWKIDIADTVTLRR